MRSSGTEQLSFVISSGRFVIDPEPKITRIALTLYSNESILAKLVYQKCQFVVRGNIQNRRSRVVDDGGSYKLASDGWENDPCDNGCL